ncbi:MAG: universal stress protein [Cyanobacteria bacterium J06581_3]
MNWLKKDCVLVPIDFSDISYQAIPVAKTYIEEPSVLKIIHVLSPMHPADPAAMWDTLKDDERMQKVQSFLKKKIYDLGYGTADVEVRIGDPGTNISDYAAEVKADLIVMPSHGERGFIRQLLIGSVAERVVRQAHCPVLVLKPSAEGEEN